MPRPPNPIPDATESVAIGKLAVMLGRRDCVRALRRARRIDLNVMVGMSEKNAGVAAQTLAKDMADASVPHQAQVSAATALLKFSDSIELDDLAGRLDEVGRGQHRSG